MQNIIINEGKNTPKVVFQPAENHFEISGRSFPENAGGFYKPIIEWIKNYMPKEGSSIDLNITFYYISTSSIISVLEILKLFKTKGNNSCNVTVHWNYHEEDDDIRRTGEDLARLSELSFVYITYE